MNRLSIFIYIVYWLHFLWKPKKMASLLFNGYKGIDKLLLVRFSKPLIPFPLSEQPSFPVEVVIYR